eukprot:389637_1
MDTLNWKIAAVTTFIAVAVIAVAYSKYNATSSANNNKKQSNNNTPNASSNAPTYPTPTEEIQENRQQTKEIRGGGSFNPGLIISKGVSSKPSSLPIVEEMGEITLSTLNKYNYNNSDRRLLSLFGVVFDVTT